jgi:transposase
VDLDARLA